MSMSIKHVKSIAPNGEQQFPYPDGTIVVKEATRPGKDFIGLVAVMWKEAGSSIPTPAIGDLRSFCEALPTQTFAWLLKEGSAPAAIQELLLQTLCSYARIMGKRMDRLASPFFFTQVASLKYPESLRCC